jgi:hypothetical protein
LFAPLPEGAVPRRKPIAPPESADGGAIAGWEQLSLELSAGAAGLRAVLVVLDGTGRPIAASDDVLYRVERVVDGAPRVEYHHATVGGRLEDDGSFRGTRWRGKSLETASGDNVQTDLTPEEASEADAAAIRTLVAEVLRRAPP